jgi:hypothetical protein
VSDPDPHLEDQIATVSWEHLRPHFLRDALFLVSSEVPLEHAAAAVARDDTDRVQALIQAEQIRRPTLPEDEAWKKDGETFRFVIVQPFVLCQRLEGTGLGGTGAHGEPR